MAITLAGEFEVERKLEDVYSFLTTPDHFAPLLPDFEALEVQDDKHFIVKLKVGVSYIRGTARVKFEMAELEPNRYALFKGHGTLPGGSADLTARFDLAESPGGTTVTWRGDAQVFGRIVSVARGLLEPLAKRNIQKLIDGLQTALSQLR
ncbi:MAG: CoxG family protein [Acidobacteriota bacterium]